MWGKMQTFARKTDMKQPCHRTAGDWLTALRPWSFTTSAIPVMATVAYLFFLQGHDGTACDWVNALLCLPMLMLLHAGGNLISDYHDHVGRVDLPGSLNGVRSMESGRFTPRLIRHYGWALTAAGAALGVAILCRQGLGPLWIGVLAVLLVVTYPWTKGHALGDATVLLGFALLPAVGVCRVTTSCYHSESLLLSLPYGLLTVAILHANNTRDIANDRRAGLVTLPILTGWRVAARVYVAEQLLPYALTVTLAVAGGLTDSRWLWLLVALASLPMAVRNSRTMLRARPGDEAGIATLDHDSAQLQFLFGLLYTLGFAIGGVMDII